MLWIIQYYHRYGTDAWPVKMRTRPSEKEIIKALPDFESHRDEWIEILGPWTDDCKKESSTPAAPKHGRRVWKYGDVIADPRTAQTTVVRGTLVPSGSVTCGIGSLPCKTRTVARRRGGDEFVLPADDDDIGDCVP